MRYPLDTWVQAMVVTAPRLCGRRLQPYSLAHEMVLRGLRNPIIQTENVSRATLLQAVWVCQHDFRECRWLFRESRWLLLRLAWFSLRWRHLPVPLSVRVWRQYREDFSAAPEHWEYEADEGRHPAAAPIEWHLVRCLCTEWGRTWDEAWNTPPSLAVCCWDVSAERNGDKTLMTRWDQMVRYANSRHESADQSGDARLAQCWANEVSELCRQYRSNN